MRSITSYVSAFQVTLSINGQEQKAQALSCLKSAQTSYQQHLLTIVGKRGNLGTRFLPFFWGKIQKNTQNPEKILQS